MEKTGKVREKSGNFVIPEKWEPCYCCASVSEIGGTDRQLFTSSFNSCSGLLMHLIGAY